MKICRGNVLPLGVTYKKGENKVQFTVWAKDKMNCTLFLYNKRNQLYKKIPMDSMKEEGAEDIFSVCLWDEKIEDKLKDYRYTFDAGEGEFIDPYARRTYGAATFGKRKKVSGGFDFSEFSWEGENRVRLDFSEMILYQCHVRGFTKHSSSKVKNPGTFSGLTEKIPYLKELGVNTLLLMPVYDFDEVMVVNQTPYLKKEENTQTKINYWGYTKKANYFAPKESYSAKGDATNEFQQMVFHLHKASMNVILDMHFSGQTADFILECLRFYVTRYHVDGFLLNQDKVSPELVMNDPVLRNVKLLGTGWPYVEEASGKKRLAAFNDGFMVDARKMLKSDEGMIATVYQRMKNQGGNQAVINYITQQNGFTLNDLVSYDVKHNEDNGENNIDGTEFNYSWNCGVEGVTRKKSVLATRKKQMKNAFMMLLLSQGTPMILAGDEFSNSQKGNNNAYCQDNITTWLDWRLLEKNKGMFEFVKELIKFRINNPIYNGRILKNLDYKGVGAPDVSCHGLEPWVNSFVNYSRELGILYYKTYFETDCSYYIAMNFHWEDHTFYLPVIDTEIEWKLVFDSETEASQKEKKTMSKTKPSYVMGPRSMAVFAGKNVAPRKKKKSS